jgi:uncharacterized protein YggU (UPF0235/DUF167 family)
MQQYKILVKPGSKKGPLIETGAGGTLTVYVRERAADGKANEAVVALLAKHFGVAKSRIAITKGQIGRAKTVCVS